MKNMLLGLAILTAITGCGRGVEDARESASTRSKRGPIDSRTAGSVEHAWESAGASVGWYGPDGMGFSELGEKPSEDSIPAFRGYKEFKFGELATLPIPETRFALHFGGSELADSHLKQLDRFSNLEALGCNGTHITNSGLAHLASLPKLNGLDLARTTIDDQGVRLLTKLPNLRTLILSFTTVSDAGAETLSQMKNLEVLDVCDTAITDKGLNTLGSLPKLRYLGVSNTKATTDSISALKRLRPNLKVYE